MGNLQVIGFGKLSLTHEGDCINAFPTHQVESLLGFLLLNQHIPHGREKLIDILWSSAVTENARGSLSTVLWRLRCVFRQLGLRASLFLQTTRDTVVFSPQQKLQFDVQCFEQAICRARSAQATTEKEAALLEAFNLYQGELYSGVSADWCLLERERFARLHLQALGQLMHFYMQHDAYQEALEFGAIILDEDPLREEVYRAMMICYARLGQRAEVAEQFRLCTRHLQNELEVLPAPQTVHTYQRAIQTSLDHEFPSLDSRQARQLCAALAEFQRAGDRLNRLFDRFERTKIDTHF
jgi:DNA-binding SARP family transcriptional activator